MNDAGPKGPGRPAWQCRSRAAVTYTESAIVESAREEHRHQSGVNAWHRNHSDVYLGTYAPHSNVWAAPSAMELAACGRRQGTGGVLRKACRPSVCRRTKSQAGGIPVRLVQPVTVAPGGEGGFCGGQTTSGGGPKRDVDAWSSCWASPVECRMMHRLLRRGYRDAQLPALRIALLSACRPRGAAPSVLGRECHLGLLEGCCVPSVAADIHQALRRRPGPGHVLSTSRHGLGPEAVLPRRSLAAESRSRRWESQAQSARREREMPRPAWRPGHGQP